MIVQFDATIDDLVDVGIRSTPKSKTMRLWRWQGGLVTALLAAFPVYLLMPGTTLVRFLAACVSGLLAGGVTLWTSEAEHRQRLQKLYREQYGTDSITVTVELLDEGLSFNQMGARIIYDWSHIERVEESEDALYFFYVNQTCSAVRKRGFDSIAIKDEFLKRAESYIQQSRGPNCSKS